LSLGHTHRSPAAPGPTRLAQVAGVAKDGEHSPSAGEARRRCPPLVLCRGRGPPTKEAGAREAPVTLHDSPTMAFCWSTGLVTSRHPQTGLVDGKCRPQEAGARPPGRLVTGAYPVKRGECCSPKGAGASDQGAKLASGAFITWNNTTGLGQRVQPTKGRGH